MKKFFPLACVIALAGIGFQSCNKMDAGLVQSPASNLNEVPQVQSQPEELIISSVGVIPKEEFMVFKMFTGEDGNTQITTELASAGGYADNLLSFNIIRSASQVAFVDAGKASDTVFIAYLNDEGKVRAVKQGNAANENFLPGNFYYKNGKLSKLEVLHGKTMVGSEFEYDSRGNISTIREFSNLDNETVTTNFGYDLSKSATSQVYFEMPSGFINNGFVLLEYAGLFPELQPKNLRTSVKKKDSYSETETLIGNHTLGLNGAVTGYDIVDEHGNVLRAHRISWKNGKIHPGSEDITGR